jgi:hypothetical protein
MVQPGRHAGKITDPIAIGVEKAARIDLIDHRAAPPVHASHPDSPHGGV